MAQHPARFRPTLCCLEGREVPARVGGLDASFSGDGKLTVDLGGNDVFNDVAIQYGKIVAVGTNGSDFVVCRFNADGSPDTTFNGTGRKLIDFGGNDVATSLVIYGADRIVVAGYTDNGNQGVVARLISSGEVDSSFNISGQNLILINGGNTKFYDIALRPDSSGSLVVAGTSNSDFVMAQIKGYSGTLDSDFGVAGKQSLDLGGNEDIRSILIQPTDGKIVLVGYSSFNNKATAIRYSADGKAVDASYGNQTVSGTKVFELGNVAESKAYAATFDTKSNVVIVGRSGPDSAANSLVFRIDANGAGVTAINSEDLGGADEFRSVKIDTAGRIIAAGFAKAGATSDFTVARFTLNTTDFDTTFGGGGYTRGEFATGSDDQAYGVAIVPRRIVIVGKAGSEVACARIIGTIGSSIPGQLVASGLADLSGELFKTDTNFTLVTPGTVINDFLIIPKYAEWVPPEPTPINARGVLGDINGDGVLDYIAGAGPGARSFVTVHDGRSYQVLVSFLQSFEASFTGGIYVAAGDMDNDGFDEVIVTADQGGGPVVVIYSGAKIAKGTILGGEILRFFGINDPSFRGGARAALGDVDNDGYLDLIVSAGFLGGPRIAVYSGKQIMTRTSELQALGYGDASFQLVGDFLAFEETVRNGAFVGSGDFDGDGHADLVFGGGPTGGPRVRVVSGKSLLSVAGLTTLDAAVASTPGLQLANFLAGDANTRGGVRVTCRDLDLDDKADLVTGSGDGLPAQILVYKGKSLAANGNSPTVDQTLTPFGGEVLANGVFVG